MKKQGRNVEWRLKEIKSIKNALIAANFKQIYIEKNACFVFWYGFIIENFIKIFCA